MGLHALQAQNFVCQISKGARAAFMASNAGIAVLALVKLLFFDSKALCGKAVDFCCRHQMNNSTTITANGRDLQRYSSLGRFCSRFFGHILCPHGTLQIKSIAAGKRQHPTLGDAKSNGSAECFQTGV